MLRTDHVFDEIKSLTKAQSTATDTEKALLKGMQVILKLLVNLRQNQVSVMKHLNIEMIKPKLETSVADEDK